MKATYSIFTGSQYGLPRLTADTVIDADLASNWYDDPERGLEPYANGGLLSVSRRADDLIVGMRYVTGSGKGEYTFSLSPNGEVIEIKFEGYRNSFRGGCNVLPYDWFIRSRDGWQLTSSSDPERGLWD